MSDIMKIKIIILLAVLIGVVGATNYQSATTFDGDITVDAANLSYYDGGTNLQTFNFDAEPTEGDIWEWSGNLWAPGTVSSPSSSLTGFYGNALGNSQFQVNQQAVSPYTSATSPANSDDTYAAPDLWCLLSDGNNVVNVTLETSVIPTGAPASCKFDVKTANKRWGIIQFIPNADALKLEGKDVSLQLKAYTTSGNPIIAIRAEVLAWNGTADTLTSDVVSAWGGGADNPTLATNWVAENTGSNLTLVADAWTTYEIEDIAIDTSTMTNLAVFVYVADTNAAAGDLLYLDDIQLNEGETCTDFMPRTFLEDLIACHGFYQKSYEYGTAPGSVNTAEGIEYSSSIDIASDDDSAWCLGFHPKFPSPMLRVPTISIWTYGGAAAKWGNPNGAITSKGVFITTKGFVVANDAGSPQSPGLGIAAGHWVADARL